MNKKPTIADVAKSVGVSKTTISRYINGNYEFMSDETRKRIENTIRELKYVPSSVARTLKSKKSNLIGIVVNSLRYQVGAQTVVGINNVCNTHGYGTIVCCSNDDPEEETQMIQHCLNQQVDGIIIIPCENSAERYLSFCEHGVPIVLCIRRVENWPYGNIYVRHDELITKMLTHLNEQGFEKVRFFQDMRSFHKDRMASVFSHLTGKLFDMSPEESITIVGRDQPRISDEIERIFSDYPHKKKAVFAINTNTLFLALKELEKRGLQIPQDIGVCGYDAVGWSELVYPGISAIRQPMDSMGIYAAEKLMHCIKEGTFDCGQLALDGTIYFRQSTQLL